MTNKLPVVGKRYRQKRYDEEERFIVIDKIEIGRQTFIFFQNKYISLKDFWLEFEELPEDNKTTKPD
jgi:hypothetical protein